MSSGSPFSAHSRAPSARGPPGTARGRPRPRRRARGGGFHCHARDRAFDLRVRAEGPLRLRRGVLTHRLDRGHEALPGVPLRPVGHRRERRLDALVVDGDHGAVKSSSSTTAPARCSSSQHWCTCSSASARRDSEATAAADADWSRARAARSDVGGVHSLPRGADGHQHVARRRQSPALGLGQNARQIQIVHHAGLLRLIQAREVVLRGLYRLRASRWDRARAVTVVSGERRIGSALGAR